MTERAPLRTLLMTADTVGGVWGYALELARALGAYEVHVVLAAMGGLPSEAQLKEARRIPNLTLETSTHRLEWMAAAWDDVRRAGEWLLELARRYGVELLHLNNYCHGALDFGVPRLVVGHSDVLSWFRAVRGEEAPREWGRYREEVARGLGAVELVCAPTQAMLSSLERDYGPFRAERVIANGRDPARFRPGFVKEPIILAAGRLWDDAKNLHALEQAAPRLTWPVEVAGPLQHPDGGLRPSRSVRLLGSLSQEELAARMAEASLFAAPARYEPFGLSIVEAALSGCALVLGDIPSLRELWDGAAAFVPPDDVDALVAALERYIAEPELRRRDAQVARERAARYAPARMASAYVAAYRGLVDAAGESACA